MRRALQIDDSTLSVTDIPVLKIIKMTDKDIEDVRNRFNDDHDDDILTAEWHCQSKLPLTKDEVLDGTAYRHYERHNIGG